MPEGGARGQNLVHIEQQYSKGLKHVFVSSACMEARHGVIRKVIVINCNLITFSKIIECNCN